MNRPAPPLETRFLDCRVERNIGVISLDRPPVNAVHQPMYREIRAVFAEPWRLDHDLRAIILTGKGRHFCAGNDLTELESMDSETARVNMFHMREAFDAVYSCPLPVIGAVKGAALGTGLVLASVCDFAVAGEGALFGLPEVGVGMVGGARHLSRMVSQPVARMMYLTAEPVSADLMHRYGGVVRVVPDGEVVDAAMEMAWSVCRHSPTVLSESKLALNRAEFLELDRGYETEQEAATRLADHPDSTEAVKAFLEKREPRYENRR